MIQMDDFGVQLKLMKMELISGEKDFGVIVMISAIKGIYIFFVTCFLIKIMLIETGSKNRQFSSNNTSKKSLNA